MKRTQTLLLCFILLFTMTAAGCNQAAKKPVNPDQSQNQSYRVKPNNTMNTSDKRVMASRLSSIAENVSGVKTATVIVDTGQTATGRDYTKTGSDLVPNPTKTPNPGQARVGNKTMNTAADAKAMAMVGITLEDPSIMGSKKERAIKQNVRQRLMSSETKLSEVLVTSDPTMIKKLKDVAAGILEGRPTSSYARDIQELNRNMRQK